jgi:hypothetical protein
MINTTIPIDINGPSTEEFLNLFYEFTNISNNLAKKLLIDEHFSIVDNNSHLLNEGFFDFIIDMFKAFVAFIRRIIQELLLFFKNLPFIFTRSAKGINSEKERLYRNLERMDPAQVIAAVNNENYKDFWKSYDLRYSEFITAIDTDTSKMQNLLEDWAMFGISVKELEVTDLSTSVLKHFRLPDDIKFIMEKMDENNDLDSSYLKKLFFNEILGIYNFIDKNLQDKKAFDNIINNPTSFPFTDFSRYITTGKRPDDIYDNNKVHYITVKEVLENYDKYLDPSNRKHYDSINEEMRKKNINLQNSLKRMEKSQEEIIQVFTASRDKLFSNTTDSTLIKFQRALMVCTKIIGMSSSFILKIYTSQIPQHLKIVREKIAYLNFLIKAS